MDDESIIFDQDMRSLKIDSQIPMTEVVLTAVTGTDQVSAPFLYDLEFETTASDNTVTGLLGKPVTVWLNNLVADDRRPINGRIRRMAGPNRSIRGLSAWSAELVPALSFLDYSADIRIFQTLSIPDILRKVFSEHSLTDYELRSLMGTYPALDYCVQYRETAFAFVSRLMEHVGLFYWHEHRDGGHKLVIADYNMMATAALPAPARTPAQGQNPDVSAIVQTVQLRPGKWTLTDYDFEAPSKNLNTDAPTIITEPPLSAYEIYDYPGLYTDKANGTSLARTRIQHEEANFSRFQGTGYRALLDAGRLLEIDPEAGAAAGPGDKLLLVQVQHVASDPLATTSKATTWTYHNQFVGIPIDRTFRPDQVTQKPFVRGVQTAVVTGPAGETIYTDKYGRVKVKFFWDRNPDGRASENSSCWLRVSQVWADNQWGAIHIPRIGEEVVVDFLEGDPDRPIITGRVYNGTNKTPYDLPANKTQSGIKSRSVPGPGSNELRFEDKAGNEEVYLHAQKDLTISVENDESDTIGHDRTVAVKVNDTRTVGGDLSDTISGNDTRHVVKNFIENVDANVTMTVGGTVTETVTGAVNQTYNSTLTQTVATGITITTPATMTVTATGGYTLNAPTSAWQHGPMSLSYYGFSFAAQGVNTQVAGVNGQAFGAQLQVVGANAAISGISSTNIGLQWDNTITNLKDTATTVETHATEIHMVAIIIIL